MQILWKTVKMIIGLIIVLVLCVAGFMYVKNNTVPDNIGVNNGRLAAMPDSPNAVSSQTKIAEKKVEPLPYLGDAAQSKAAVKAALAALGTATVVEENDNYIHAVDTTPKMRYHDDLEFFFDDGAKLVQFRSASRVGYSDMGLNRSRYDRLRKLYMKQAATGATETAPAQ